MARGLKEENLRLRTLLDEAAMSNKGLARRVVDLAAPRGMASVRCDHTSVLRWLAGEQPRPPVPELVAEVLSNALGRKVSETELGLTPSDLPGDLGLQLPTGWTETIATSTALWRADVQRRRFLVNAVFTSAALPASALRWLTSPPAAAPSASGTRQVGRADIDAIRELTRSYREMDNRLGGGKLRSSVVSYLDDHVSRLLTAGSYREETGRQLAAACGELSQLAGWVAYDSDEHGLAQRYLTQALAYSRHADDHALAAEVLAGQAHQALYLARADEAVDLARAAQAAAVRHGSATLLTECLVMEAHGHAARNDARACGAVLAPRQSRPSTGLPARTTRRGCPTSTRHTWPPAWRSASATSARQATPPATRAAPWTWTAATYAAGPSTSPCSPPPTPPRASRCRRRLSGGRHWT
jgi:hypothetical protein